MGIPSVPTPTPAPAPAPAPRTSKPPSNAQKYDAGRSKFDVFRKGQNDVGGISLPKFTSDTGALMALLLLNVGWSIVRGLATHPEQGGIGVKEGTLAPQHGSILSIVVGAWIVGLGLLIVHEFDPHLAMLLALLFVIGNILTNNAGNQVMISAIQKALGGGGSAGAGGVVTTPPIGPPNTPNSAGIITNYGDTAPPGGA